MRSLSIVVALLCSTLATAGVTTRTLTVDGVERSFVQVTPTTVRLGTPLLISLHGQNGDGNAQRVLTRYRCEALPRAKGGVAVFPNGVNESWADGRGESDADRLGVDDVNFLRVLIAQLRREFQPSKVYLMGMSNGSFMTGRAYCEGLDLDGMAQIAATLALPVAASCAPARTMPVVTYQGTNDPLVWYGGSGTSGFLGGFTGAEQTSRLYATLNGCDATPPTSVLLPNSADDGTTVERQDYSGCGRSTVFYKVIDGGHNWPGGILYSLFMGKITQDVNACETAWALFGE